VFASFSFAETSGSDSRKPSKRQFSLLTHSSGVSPSRTAETAGRHRALRCPAWRVEDRDGHLDSHLPAHWRLDRCPKSDPRPRPRRSGIGRLAGFPRLGGLSAPSLALWEAKPLVPQPSPFWRPIPAYRPVSSPELRRRLAVVRLIRKERLTCCRFLRFAAGEFQGTRPRVWQVRWNSSRRVR